MDLLLEEYFSRFYGPAAEPMGAYSMTIAFLQQHGPRVKELTTQYGSGGSY